MIEIILSMDHWIDRLIDFTHHCTDCTGKLDNNSASRFNSNTISSLLQLTSTPAANIFLNS